jgi:nicotinamide-nucleotide amidase
MADGARDRTGAEVALAVSGIAGPAGGSDSKPVGLVWFAWAFPDGLTSASRVFAGDRDGVRRWTVDFALSRTIALLER